MILCAQSIYESCQDYRRVIDPDILGLVRKEPRKPLITPFTNRGVINGKSYGLSSAGYDIRVGFKNENGDCLERITMYPGDFILAYSLEYIRMPTDLLCIVHDKSSWAREGVALQNTVLEPGWEGHITLELSYHRPKHKAVINFGDPIAQLIFHVLDQPTDRPYSGKYQNQPDKPVEAIYEQGEKGN